MRLPTPAPLRPFVDTIWVLDSPAGAPPQPVVADGAVDLIVRFGSPVLPVNLQQQAPRMRHGQAHAYVLGPRLLPVFVHLAPATRMAGVRFRPGGAYPFFGTDLAVLTDCAVALADLWRPCDVPASEDGDGPEALMGTIVAALMARLPRASGVQPSVAAATTALQATGGRLSVGALAAHVGLSERQLERLFRVYVGISPKALARVLRVHHARQALWRSPRQPLADVALQAGFADQAHLTRESTALLGAPPGRQRRLSPAGT